MALSMNVKLDLPSGDLIKLLKIAIYSEWVFPFENCDCPWSCYYTRGYKNRKGRLNLSSIRNSKRQGQTSTLLQPQRFDAWAKSPNCMFSLLLREEEKTWGMIEHTWLMTIPVWSRDFRMTPPLNALDHHHFGFRVGLWSLLLQRPSQKALEGPWGWPKIVEIRVVDEHP